MFYVLFLPSSTDQISSSESLFTYLNGYSAANYSHPSYIPAFLEDVLANASNAIKMACSNDSSCIFDYSQTGSMAIGLGTLATNTQNNINNMIACKHCYHGMYCLSVVVCFAHSSQLPSKHNWSCCVPHQHQCGICVLLYSKHHQSVHH